jgi:hypothetical protein
MQSSGQSSSQQGRSESGKQSAADQKSQADGQQSSTANSGGASKGGKEQKNQKAEDAAPQLNPTAQADSRSGDGDGSGKKADELKFDKEPWFAKLPPSLRGAIQAKSRGKAPRGYEERLKRYFENID